MSNNISFVGRLGRDGDFKKVGEHDLLELAVANNIGFGEKKKTNWFRCKIWGKQATSLQPHMVKGKEVIIHGELEFEEYTKKDGTSGAAMNVRVKDLDFCGSQKGEGQQSTPTAPQPKNDIDPDDMPF
jgi:single-strand DNA-binding protein